MQEALAAHAAPRKQGHCAQRCSLLTGPRWDSKLKGSDVNILPSSLSKECLSLYLTLKPHPYSPVMYPPPLTGPLSNLTVKNVFGGRNGELRASRDSWWREELKPWTMWVKLSNESGSLWLILPIVPADEAVKGLGKMFEPPQTRRHGLQILVKFSVSRCKRDS